MRSAAARRLLLLAVIAGASASALAADIAVEVRGVDGPLRDNVLAFLSLNRFSGAAGLDQDMVDRLARRAEREAAQALRPFGYYAPEVRVETESGGGGWKATVTIEPGEPVVLIGADVRIEGPGRDEPFFRDLLRAPPLVPGQRLSHAAYEQTKGELQRAAAVHGYLDASWSEAELAVDPARLEARATLALDTGERYRFGPTTFEQDFLDPDLVARYLRYREGDWYDATLLLRTQFALDDSEYFSVVEVLPQPRDRVAKLAPVRIDAQRNRRHRYRVGLGYATDTETRVTLGWTNRQLNRHGHRLTAEATYASIEQGVEFGYTIPWEDPALEKLAFSLKAGRKDRGDVETRGYSLLSGLTQVQGRWQRVLFASLDYTEDRFPAQASIDTAAQRQRSLLVAPGISYGLLPPGFLRSDEVGRGLYGELIGSTGALGSDADFVRLLVRDERRLGLGGPWSLILRGELGTSAVGDFQELPAKYRFFAGGDRSVRGYGYEELSPTDADGNRIGGRHMLVASVEVERTLPRNFAVAAFVDAGNAFNRFGDGLQYSAGLGLRYRLPFVSIGFDVAQSVSEPDRSPRLHLNFTPIL
jgi:translocation and assembly module TamA